MDYVDHMKEGQNDISYITGESITVVSSLFEENLREKGHEVPYMADPVDECAVHQFKEFGGKMLKSTTKEGLDLVDDDEKKTLEELNTEFEPLAELTEGVLGDKGEKVIVSDRIVDSPCVLATSEYGWSVKMERIMEAQALRDNSMTSHMMSKAEAQQQRHWSSKHQPTKQATQQEREGGKKEKSEKVEGERWETVAVKGRKGQRERERGQEGRRNEEEREAEEGRGKQVEEDETGWTEVARKKRKKMVQIFVKVDGSRVTPVEVNLTDDKVEDVMRQIQKDEDVYVTMQGKVLRRDEKLRSCGVTDGCTIQVTSRLRGGGRSKNKTASERRKKSPKEMKQDDKSSEEKNVSEVDTIAEMLERSFRTGAGGWSAEMLEAMMGMDDEQTERMLKMLRNHVAKELGCDPEMVIGGMKKFVQEQKRRGEVVQEQQQQREEETAQQRQHEEAEARSGSNGSRKKRRNGNGSSSRKEQERRRRSKRRR